MKVERIPLLFPISQHHSNIQLYMDLFYIYGHTFLYTKYFKVDFISAQACIPKSKVQIMKVIYTVIQLYKLRGFEITAFRGDNYFNIQTLKYFLLP